MKKKHIIALICVLALAVSLMSSFSFAAAPEVEFSENMTRAIRYKVAAYGTYMYNSPSENSGYKRQHPIPVGTYVTNTIDYGIFVYGTAKWNGETLSGYILRSQLAPT